MVACMHAFTHACILFRIEVKFLPARVLRDRCIRCIRCTPTGQGRAGQGERSGGTGYPFAKTIIAFVLPILYDFLI